MEVLEIELPEELNGEDLKEVCAELGMEVLPQTGGVYEIRFEQPIKAFYLGQWVAQKIVISKIQRENGKD